MNVFLQSVTDYEDKLAHRSFTSATDTQQLTCKSSYTEHTSFLQFYCLQSLRCACHVEGRSKMITNAQVLPQPKKNKKGIISLFFLVFEAYSAEAR